MKVELKFFFPVLIKIKSFREASSHIFSPYLKRKNFGGKQNFPPKSCFPNSETKRANSIASVEKECLNYRKIIRQQQIYQLLTHFRLPAKLCPKCDEAQQQTYCFSAGNLFKSIIIIIIEALTSFYEICFTVVVQLLNPPQFHPSEKTFFA